MDWVVGALLILGSGLAVVAATGVLRLPDVLIRMHASTKVGTLSSGLVMLAAALHFGDAEVVVRAVAIMLFLLLTAPIAGHMIGRAVIQTGVPLWRGEARGHAPADMRGAGEPRHPQG